MIATSECNMFVIVSRLVEFSLQFVSRVTVNGDGGIHHANIFIAPWMYPYLCLLVKVGMLDCSHLLQKGSCIHFEIHPNDHTSSSIGREKLFQPIGCECYFTGDILACRYCNRLGWRSNVKLRIWLYASPMPDPSSSSSCLIHVGATPRHTWLEDCEHCWWIIEWGVL